MAMTCRALMRAMSTAVAAGACLALAGCGGGEGDDHAHDHGDGTHTHADGTTHADHDHDHDHDGDHDAEDGHDADHHHDHAHEEVSLGEVTVDGVTVALAQGHGALEAGGAGHLVVQLSYTDDGASKVRAWIGGAEPGDAGAGTGVYAPSHDDYDVEAPVPEPLPAGAMWWFEVERPDGTVLKGSIAPLTG